jgi:hypothetical protein
MTNAAHRQKKRAVTITIPNSRTWMLHGVNVDGLMLSSNIIKALRSQGAVSKKTV